MKYLFGERAEKGLPDEPLLAATQGKGVVRKQDYGSRTVTATKDLHLLKLVEKGDFVISLRSFQGGIELAHYRGIISPAYTVLEPRREVSQAYYERFLKSTDFVRSLSLFVTGIREGQNIDYERLSRSYLPLPPLQEQEAIGRFLAWANGRLERAIRAKRKVIALLVEQRKATFQRLVTQGLAYGAQRKASGVVWLGDIPWDWEVRPLKAVCRIQSGVTLGKSYEGQPTEEFPYLRVANVQVGHLKLDSVKRIRIPSTEARRSRLQTGDVLMTEGGDPDKLGRGCVWEGQLEPCLHQNHVFAVRPDPRRLSSAFLVTLLEMTYARVYFQSTAKQTTNLAGTSRTKVGQLKVPLPSREAQDAIVRALANETKPIDTAISRFEREIALLREYRTRLTADVVTGKLDVREAASRLPEEIEPLPASDPTEPDPDAEDDAEPGDEGEGLE